ncbi:MAG: Na+/H+ antiporter NhaA [Thermoleophilia bacterium]
MIWRPFRRFFQTEASSGIVLLAAVALALAWANLWPDAYESLWRTKIPLGIGSLLPQESFHLWINEGLMAVFFLVVGLEIKRELVAGELSSGKKAMLPAIAAIGGMLVPAIIFLLLNNGGAGARGWGIPMATDIALAIGVLTLLGKRVPFGLKVFLTALAIIDDIGAVIIIALFYTASVSWAALGAGLALFALLLLLNRLGVKTTSVYLVVGLGIWLAFLRSGVHATIAGVLLALAVPSSSKNEREPLLERLERLLQPWAAYFIVPLFALANAGIHLEKNPLQSLSNPIGLGIILGLFFGKQIGVVLFSWLAVRLRLGSLPPAVSWRHMHGAACLAGVGFTMSLFISLLAFEDPGQLTVSKMGVLAGSTISGLAGLVLLAVAGKPSGRKRPDKQTSQ